MKAPTHKKLTSERNQLLKTIVGITEVPLIVLGFVWLGLLILELLNKSTPLLEKLGIAIWIIFIADFTIKFIIAASKVTFIKKNVLTIISLIVPAFRLLRIFRIIRLIRLSRGLRLVKLVGSFNRGMRSLAQTMKKRAFGYVLLLSFIVVVIGAAGLYAFEKDLNPGFKNYSSALWWTAMLIISMGTENWPVTPEGRVLAFMIAVFGLAVFGYVTATIASFFIGRDVEDKTLTPARNSQIDELKKEIQSIHSEILKLKNSQDKP